MGHPLEELTPADFERMSAEHETTKAQRDSALMSVASLLALLDSIGGHTSHEQQAAIRIARSLLAEAR